MKYELRPGGVVLIRTGANPRWKTFEECHTILVQDDWDYPGIASNLGFVPCDKCRKTDGTVDCKHKTAHQMIGEAWDFLVAHEGETFEDPGYFE